MAAAKLFGPPDSDDGNGRPSHIDEAKLVAALVALGAKMAKADGQVRSEDIVAFRQVFRTDPQTEATIGRFFNLARQTTLGYQRYARIVAKAFRAQPGLLEDVMDGLFHIALADGIVTAEEADYLETVASVFGFSEREYRRIRNSHLGQDADDPYLILGVDPDISDKDLKTAYRRQAAANHPDRLMARGLPKEMIGIATHKMAIINRAYAQILEERKAHKPRLA
jgi:DnaJ like chaperone protein